MSKPILITIPLRCGEVSLEVKSPKDKIKATMSVSKETIGTEEDKDVIVYLPSYASFAETIFDLESLFNKEIENIKSEKRQSPGCKYKKFSMVDLKNNNPDVKSSLIEDGRVLVEMRNSSLITLCKPALCFESKPDIVKNRLSVEKNYWLKHKNDLSENGISLVSEYMLNNFEF